MFYSLTIVILFENSLTGNELEATFNVNQVSYGDFLLLESIVDLSNKNSLLKVPTVTFSSCTYMGLLDSKFAVRAIKWDHLLVHKSYTEFVISLHIVSEYMSYRVIFLLEQGVQL